MRVAYITAGAAGMYCGSCLHDNTLAAALLALGEDVLLVPTYTPLRTDEPGVSIDRIFFGGINVYLQQKSAIFRRTPWWFDRLLDHPTLIETLSRRAGSVDGFDYSTAMRQSGIVWNEASLDRFLADPMRAVPGTSMGYAGIADARERADLIAWLRQAGGSSDCGN